MKEHKLAAIVFTDIVGYTKRMEADEEATMKLLARQREIVFPIVKEFGGEVIKEIGDGLMMMFTSANRAVRFAIAIQEKLTKEELTIRAGIHIGDVIFEEGDVFGSAVNIAARIEPLAPAGGICISEDVRSQIRNQKDIYTVSIGKKDLKGVDGSIEIFNVVSEAEEMAKERIPFYIDIWKRRVIQITVIYLILSFLVKLVIGFMVKEYLLSPHLTNLVWYILLSLIPSIILISYFHGKKGVSKWTRVELIGLPLNIVVAVLVLVFVFKGKDLGAMTTKLTVENEEGEKVEKIILKSEFRKGIYLFNFETKSKDSAMVYLQYSLPSVLEYDLAQDLFISSQPALEDFQDMIDAGYPDGVGLPVTLMQKLAEKNLKNYFLTGDFNKEGEELVLNARLYDTKLTKLISEFTVRSTDPFTLVDQITIEAKKGMGLPESHISETVDLPVAEIFTGSEKALYLFSKSMRARLERNWEDHIMYLNKAIDEDPGFALAYVIITISYFNNNDFDAAQDALDKALKLQYKLPEREQFSVKYVNYVLDQQPEKALAVVKMWTELYPNDLEAHTTLAMRYAVRNQFAEAIEANKVILQLDPEQYNVLNTVAQYYLQIGEYDSALVYLKKYADNLPQQSESFQNLGDYYSTTGDMEMARANYEKALLLADANEEHSIKIDLANVLLHTGNFNLAFDGYMDALATSVSNTDSIRAYNALQHYYLTKGQAQKSLQNYESKVNIMRVLQAPKDHMVYRVMTIEPYIHAKKIDEAMDILDNIAGELPPPINDIVTFGYLFIYAETGDTASAREAIRNAEKLIKGFGEEVLRANLYYVQGKLNELLGNYQDAIGDYSMTLERNLTNYFLHTMIARCYRNLKEFKKAEEEIQKALKYRPFNPENNYEAALLYIDMGEEGKGLEFLSRAVDIWKDADPDYDKANEAKDLLASYN